jgi:hypothetical protein
MVSSVVVKFLAPVPVGHTLTLDFFAHDTGFISTDIQVDRRRPVITDLTTGIRYAADSSPYSSMLVGEPVSSSVRHVERVTAIVRACTVLSDFGDVSSVETVLVIEPVAEPRAG